MRKHFSALALVIAALGANQALADNYYGSIKLQQSAQALKNADLTSPRVDYRLDNPGINRSPAASIAIGKRLAEDWRLEAEYTTLQHSSFDTHWSPFDANVNRMKVKSQRLMVNAYRDFAIGEKVSVYGTLGMGIAHIDSQGYQGTRSREFAHNSQNNLAYSAGLGADFKVNEDITLGAGYRVVHSGRIETGHNTFANRINARDEQLKGKLVEQNLFVELRHAF